MTTTPATKPRIEIDPSKLTFGDWVLIQDMSEGKLRAREIVQLVTRASDWTEEQVLALPADATASIINSIGESLGQLVNPKN